MSNALAIAAVTKTLRSLLADHLADDGGIYVTTLPPDKAPTATEGAEAWLNLFLYGTHLNGAWRNLDLPGQVRPGETGQTPLALDLDYLVTAYEKKDGDNEAHAHRLLGRAMLTLHDRAVLGPSEIQDALRDANLHQQIERVRITPQPLSMEELSKLWMILQTPYRLSAAYRASVVLIESRQPTRTPLPVLRRGEADGGVEVRPDLVPRYPTLEAVEIPGGEPSARLGDRLTLRGHHLDGERVSVRLGSPRFRAPRLVAASGDPSRVEAVLPTEPPRIDPPDPFPSLLPADLPFWPAGLYGISVSVTRSGRERVTNELPFAIAPMVSALEPATASAGEVNLTVTFTPRALPGQRAVLLFGDQEIQATPPRSATAAPTNRLRFVIPGARPGEHYVRLRIDGVDSRLVDRTTTRPQFDDRQRFIVT